VANDIVPATIVSEPLAPQSTPWRGCLPIAGLTAGRLGVHLFAIFVVLGVLCGGYPVAWRLFEKENLKVPAITAQIYTLSFRATHYSLLSIPATLAFLLFDTLLLAWLESLSERWRWLARIWFASVLVAALAFVGVVFTAAMVPIATLVPDEAAAFEENADSTAKMPSDEKN